MWIYFCYFCYFYTFYNYYFFANLNLILWNLCNKLIAFLKSIILKTLATMKRGNNLKKRNWWQLSKFTSTLLSYGRIETGRDFLRKQNLLYLLSNGSGSSLLYLVVYLLLNLHRCREKRAEMFWDRLNTCLFGRLQWHC